MSSKPGRSRRSMATWMAAWYAASASALLLVATASLDRSVAAWSDAEADSYLDVGLARLEDEFTRSGRISDDPDEFWDGAARVTDAGGEVLGATDQAAARLPQAPTTEPVGVDHLAPNGRWFRIKSRRVGSRVYEVGYDRTREFEVLGRYRRTMGFILVPSVAAASAVGMALARRGLRPLGEFAATARRIGPSRMAERVTLQALPAELRDLAETFNAMLSRLQDSFERLERFSADIAHELRTPVHALRNAAEVTLQSGPSAEGDREALEVCLESAERLSRLIERLLFLARADDPRMVLELETVDLAVELASIRDFYEPAASEAGIDLVVDATPPLPCRLDRTLLQRAVGNLLTNAFAHTLERGRVLVSATLGEGWVVVSVADTGTGIAAEHLPRIFDRFYRPDAARSGGQGVGLGLSIVKSIAELHGGHVTIASEDGEGTVVAMHLPAARDDGTVIPA